MISRTVFAGVCAAGLLALAGCERGGTESQPARAENISAPVPSPDAEDLASARETTAPSDASGQRASREGDDPRDGPQPMHDDGAPIWSANSRAGAAENAQRQFERNGEDFGADTVDEYVDRAHAFIAKPPAGTERATRARNGDRLFYDPKSNTFLVATREGAPRTMFKPDDGAAYWAKQKQQASRRGGGGRDDDRG